MKKTLFLLMALLSTGSLYAYDNTGFWSYEETDQGINFSCTQQCIIALGEMQSLDYIQISGILKGQGDVTYGFLLGQQFAAGQTFTIWGATSINTLWYFSDNSFYSQMPPNTQVVLVINGSIQGQGLSLKIAKLSFGAKIAKARTDFWTNDTLQPYSINLRYGVMVLWAPLQHRCYYLRILGLIVIAFESSLRKKFLKNAFYWSMWIVLLFGVRDLVNRVSITRDGVTAYDRDGSFFDLGDYIPLTDAVRQKLSLDTDPTQSTCTIWLQGPSWPIVSHWDSVYLRPCTSVTDKKSAKYLLYFHTSPDSGDVKKTVLLNFNGSLLLDNK